MVLPYIRRLWPFLGVQILNFNILLRGVGGLGYDELWISLGGHRKTGLFLGAISIHSRAFSLGQDTDSELDFFFFFFGGGEREVANFQLFFFCMPDYF